MDYRERHVRSGRVVHSAAAGERGVWDVIVLSRPRMASSTVAREELVALRVTFVSVALARVIGRKLQLRCRQVRRGDRRNAPHVLDDAADVRRSELLEAEVNGLRHRTERRPAVLRVAGLEVALHLLLRPGADTGLLVAGEVVCAPALGVPARELLTVVERLEHGAGRMAVTAVAERLREVCAAIP